MPVSQWFARRMRFFVPVVGFILAAAAGEFARGGDIVQTSAPSCVTCPLPGCCPTDPSTAPTPATDPTLDPEVAFAPLQSTLLTPEAVAISPGGYIDDAVPRTSLRLRFDSAFNNNRPDRAEYFYAKCGCFRRLGVDPGAAGPVPAAGGNPAAGQFLETSVDYQDIRLQMEYAFQDRASVFVELPVRFLDPDVNDNTSGFADLNFGLKYALIACPDRYVTLQIRAYVPTGDSGDGLGTDHYSIEPGLLFYRQLSDKLVVIGEIKDWIPLDANDGPIPTAPSADFSGNIVQYGIGFGYEMYRNNCSGLTVTPVVEFVGWSVLDGLATASTDGTLATFRLEGAEDTIINSKIGVRIGFDGNGISPGSQADSSSLYIGWGHALTGGDRWYEDIARVEYRVNF